MTKPTIGLLMAGALAVGACATNDDFAAGGPYEEPSTLGSVATGAAVGAAAGAGAGALIGGLSPIEGALIGAAVGGLAGAVWADRDRDGHADGYYHNGQYYEGRPPEAAPVYRAPVRSGERG